MTFNLPPASSMKQIPSRIICAVLSLFGILLVGMWFLNQRSSPGLTWSIPELDRVAMHIIPVSSRYAMGAESWHKLLPTGGHTVHATDPDGTIRTYTVALFHQLRCLEILQDAYVDEGSHLTSPLAAHCMNYLRQTILCQMDMRTEVQGSVFTYNGFDQMCYDWEPIYAAAERNFETFTTQYS
ncbi:hypothetical protein DFH06DRAFT_1215162 [Mycena polygramma]|nr:hypothetical protein DFH06DRAFT_1215162 [Mycena polygramma]